MKLRLHTDYSLRVLLLLAHLGRQSTADEVARIYGISKDHIVKIVQQLATLGYVRTKPGRGGGFSLAKSPEDIDVGQIVGELEGRTGVLDCVADPGVCSLEPGCGLRRLLIRAEHAFFAELDGTTLADLAVRPRRGGVHNLNLE